MNKIKVGFIGLGLMGFPMAKNIIKKKYPLIAWSRSKKNFKKIKKLGAKVCQNLIDLPLQCRVIIMMLANDKACLEVSEVLLSKKEMPEMLEILQHEKLSNCRHVIFQHLKYLRF